jgi:hypothetical protein
MSSPNEPKFKVGEKCYCDFILQTVKETEQHRITCVTDGICSHSAYDLTDECFLNEPTIEEISKRVDNLKRMVFEINHNSLNYPAIHNFLLYNWCEMCNNKNDIEKVNALFTKTDNFIIALINKVDEIKTLRIEGIKIFN